MTFIEKLKSEHPEDVNRNVILGEGYCPEHYKYETESDCNKVGGSCKACWHREMPEAEEEKASFEKKCEELYAWCETSKCAECPVADFVGIDEVCEFAGMPEEDLDKFLEVIRAAEKKTSPEAPAIKSSGNRREFETGAVRDEKEGKGRMDLLPWGAILEVAKHSEKGSHVYGEHNVDKGIPLSSLCDSGARHLAKFIDGWEDEDHLLAATWNLLWAVQMRLKKPEMCDVPWKEDAK